MNMNGSGVTVRTFRNEMEAHLAQGRLKRNGINATVHRYSRYAAMRGAGYILKTSTSDAAKARAILSELDSEVDMDEYVETDDRSYRRCPQCNSVNVKPRPLPGKLKVLSLVTGGVLLLFLKRDWICKKCGHQWRD